MLRNSCSLAFPPPESSAILLSRFDQKNVFPVGLWTPCKNTLRPSIFCVIFCCKTRPFFCQLCGPARNGTTLCGCSFEPRMRAMAPRQLPSEPNQQLMSSSVFAGRLVESILFVSMALVPVRTKSLELPLRQGASNAI